LPCQPHCSYIPPLKAESETDRRVDPTKLGQELEKMNPEDLPAQQPPPDAESPLAFLRAAARSTPSAEILSQLAESNVTDGVKLNADLSAPYLAAVARHLTTEVAVGTARTRTFREAEASQTIAKIFAVSFLTP
jgi:hypothetical protein